ELSGLNNLDAFSTSVLAITTPVDTNTMHLSYLKRSYLFI
ncbi:856_t:CDS:1, partial [Funneliformis geosporum]